MGPIHTGRGTPCAHKLDRFSFRIYRWVPLCANTLKSKLAFQTQSFLKTASQIAVLFCMINSKFAKSTFLLGCFFVRIKRDPPVYIFRVCVWQLSSSSLCTDRNLPVHPPRKGSSTHRSISLSLCLSFFLHLSISCLSLPPTCLLLSLSLSPRLCLSLQLLCV